jgi:hypothetical protein
MKTILKSFLMLFLFVTLTFAQTDWEILYQEDFEDGAAQYWDLDPSWEILYESDNYFLKGQDHTWANFDYGDFWKNYSLECDIKLINNSSIHINVRHSSIGRYFIGFNQEGVYLQKQQPWDIFHWLAEYSEDFSTDIWYTVNVTCNDDTIEIYVNDDLKIQFQDLNFLTYGTIAFETLEESTVHIDNILVRGEPVSHLIEDKWEKIFIDSIASGELFPCVGDIEDDGDQDILISYFTSKDTLAGNIFWYESPSWEKHVIDDDIGLLELIDFNNDDKTDIVAANLLAGEVVWYEAPSWTRHVIGSLPMAAGISVVDLDKDEDLDVIASSASPGSIVWYEAPSWTAHIVADEETSPKEPVYIETVDIDLDSDIDIIIGTGDGIFLFEAPDWNSYAIGDSNVCAQFGLGDIDHDGDTDMIVGDHDLNMIFCYYNPTWNKDTLGVNQDQVRGIGVADIDMDDDLDVVSIHDVGFVKWNESPEWDEHLIDYALRGGSFVCVEDMDGDGFSDIVACGSDIGHIIYYKSLISTGIPQENPNPNFPQFFDLHQNYPNPFNPSTIIRWQLPATSQVELRIYNILGEKVATLVSEKQKAGSHQVEWDASRFSSGIYFYRIEAGAFQQVRKMVYLK